MDRRWQILSQEQIKRLSYAGIFRQTRGEGKLNFAPSEEEEGKGEAVYYIISHAVCP